jgi:hypothetical protein
VKQLDFTLQLIVTGVAMGNRNSFSLSNAPAGNAGTAVSMTVRVLKPEERGPYFTADDALCAITAKMEPPREALEAFRSLVSSGGYEHLPPSDWPTPLLSFFHSVQSEMQDAGLRTLRVLRWVRGTPGAHDLLKGVQGFDGSMDGKTLAWKFLPGIRGLHVRVYEDLTEGWVSGASLLSLGKGHDEPLGHNLFREAESQRYENPRSALVIGIAAVEIGLKECIADLVPQARWLVENIPSPPLDKLLQHYLPSLPMRGHMQGKGVTVPKRLRGVVRKAVTLRNATVHSESKGVSAEDLNEILDAVRDLLYLFDACRGHDWALLRLRSSTQTLLQEAGLTWPERIVFGSVSDVPQQGCRGPST